MNISEPQARRSFLNDSTVPVTHASAVVLQHSGGFSSGPWARLMLKKGAFFAGSILFSLLLLISMNPTAYAATQHVNHLFCGGVESIYTHIATSGNTVGNYTDLNDPESNNNPNAFIEVTPNYAPNGVFDNHPIGVWYHNGVWSIFNQDWTPMPLNAAFNVYILPSSNNNGARIIHIATSANSVGDYTNINAPASNGHPEVILTVTPNYAPNEVYDNHPIGVWYHSGIWSIFNQDLTPIPLNAAFNVDIEEPVVAVNGNISTHIATTANSRYDYTDLNATSTNSNPTNTFVFVTPNYNPYGVYNNNNIGVWYHSRIWSIFNQSGASIPNNAAFNVMAFHLLC